MSSNQTDCYHGRPVQGIGHIPFAWQLTSTNGPFLYTNKSGSKQYIQQMSLGPSGGTPTIRITINGDSWTKYPSATGTGPSFNEQDLALGLTLDFAAANGGQEIELSENASIEIDFISGTGSVFVFLLLGYGVV